MSLFVFHETPAGYALLKAKDKKLLKHGGIAEKSRTAEAVSEMLKLKKFAKYEDGASAVEQAMAVGKGQTTSMIEKILSSIKDESHAKLAVADHRLGNAISRLPNLDISVVSDSTTEDLFRAIREHISSLIPEVAAQDMTRMSLGLSHSLSRAKLKFSPEKMDTMLVQAIALVDDVDKDVNTISMRVKEWYGWHFPELAKILNDNIAYSRVILAMGFRSNAVNADLAPILEEHVEASVKAAAEVSMGVEITQEDLDQTRELAQQAVDMSDYRKQLHEYLAARMNALAPNLTELVGEMVGARLIAHAGGLMNLAKSPASTIQILGAEKALFRALKTKHDTPKYGLIYHASLVGQASGKNKGKIARMLSTKTALGLRIDTMSDWGVRGDGKEPEPTEDEKKEISRANRIKLERRLKALDNNPNIGRAAVNGHKQTPTGKFAVKETRTYNAEADGVAATAPARKAAAKIEVVEQDEDEDMEDAAGSDDSPAPKTNGDSKHARMAAKAAKKNMSVEEYMARRQSKKASKSVPNGDGKDKKRKRKSEDVDASEKKKKKKHKD